MIKDLFHDYGIETAPEDDKHHRPGWVNVECPFCGKGSGKYHLGFNVNSGYFHCFSCGKDNIRSLKQTISKVIGVSEKQANELIHQYKVIKGGQRQPAKVQINKKQFRLPPDTGEMRRNHRRYLEKRRYDPDWLQREWGIMGTGPMAKLDGTDYKHRILTPIYWEGRQVSFQTRDITNKHSHPYLACPQEREIIDHKKVLYRHPDLIQWKWDKAIVVEGVFDAWRFGSIAVATFGIGYTNTQLMLLAKFKKIYTAFDPEPQAQQKAKNLRGELKFRGVECYNIDLETDPGDMSQDEADYLVKQIINNKL